MSNTKPPKYWIKDIKTNIYRPRKIYEFISHPEKNNVKYVRKSIYDVVTKPEYKDFFKEFYEDTKWDYEVVDDKVYTKLEKESKTVNNTRKKKDNSDKNVTRKSEEKDEKIEINEPIDANKLEVVELVENNEEPSLQSDHESAKSETNETKVFKEMNDSYLEYLYPRTENADFINEIYSHKEFNDHQYDGAVFDIKTQSEKLCEADFELLPHQNFVKNFMSFTSPYNSLLLYHGLGSGKTCSAIGIAEEMRKYMKQIGNKGSIIIVASPNVQDNFKSQLFNEEKLVNNNGLWSMNTCVGDSLLREINPTTNKNMKRNTVIKEIKMMIQSSYTFMGYTQFTNYITNSTSVTLAGLSMKDKKKIRKKKMKSLFSNRLIIIDEVHNLRITRDNSETNIKSAEVLMEVVHSSENLKLLLLSATPMFNSYEEIIWLTNLMNLNDDRDTIEKAEIFNKNGDFKENGKELLVRKLTGYVSYVRGENPYTFPVRIYGNSDQYLNMKYIRPTTQLNLKLIKDELKYLQLFYNSIGMYQNTVYTYLMRNMNTILEELYENMNKQVALFENMNSFGYTLLQKPLELLNITYPCDEFDEKMSEDATGIIQSMTGKVGLSNIMKYKEEKIDDNSEEKNIKVISNYEYKNMKYGRIFSQDEIHKYSAKIANICKIIKESEGIILIYSWFIDGGIIPMALALEEMGFTRYSSHKNMKSLMKAGPEAVDYRSFKKSTVHGSGFHKAKYVMITGDKNYSRTNDLDIKYVNRPENRYGENVKVILISRAASEGVDFKNIRQIHIMDPWYNMNRIEQIIGRGVRNGSHCALPFEKRNVEIFLHSTQLTDDVEAADTYVYRVAEKKSLKIGKITRLLKENSIDCLIHKGQNNFTANNIMQTLNNQYIEYILPNGNKKQIIIGDKPFTSICDYMDTCEYVCNVRTKEKEELLNSTYNDTFMVTNNAVITKKIKELFLDIPGEMNGKFFYTKKEIVNTISTLKEYPHEQINYALYNLVNNNNEFLLDKYGRVGRLVNKGVYYFFQPIEITNDDSSLFEREKPVDYKSHHIELELNMNFKEITDDITETLDSIKENLKEAFQNNEDASTWYRNFHDLSNYLADEYGISKEKQKKYVLDHILDSLKFSKKIDIMNYVYKNKKLNHLEKDIKEYFDERIIISDKDHNNYGILMSEDNKNIDVFVFNDDGWVKSDFSESQQLLSSKTNLKNIILKNKLNEFIGFFEYNKSSEEYMFKIRDLKDSVNKKGARVINMVNKDIIVKLNEVIGENKYNAENIQDVLKSARKDSRLKMSILLEMIIRNYEDKKKDGKIWFINNEQMIFNKMYEYKKN